jgi:hypothetical protein
VLSSVVGGALGKLAVRYGAPWKWKKFANLVTRTTGLLGDLIDGVKGFFKASKKCHSFAPGTLVLMADGTKKPIEKIKPGEKVIATDPASRKTKAQAVVATHINLDVALTDLVIGKAGKDVLLQTTANHPFWSEDRQAWVNAAELRMSESLLTDRGSTLSVSAVTAYSGSRVMHDLTVNAVHTYYVLAGKTPVLVHNCDLASYADSLRPGFNKVDGSFFAAKYTSASGRTYFGHSGHNLTPAPGGAVDSLVRRFTPEGGRYHAGCAETMCLIQAEAAEGAAGIRGGSFEVVKVRGLNSPPGGAHGSPASPCPTVCQPRLDNQGISY